MSIFTAAGANGLVINHHAVNCPVSHRENMDALDHG